MEGISTVPKDLPTRHDGIVYDQQANEYYNKYTDIYLTPEEVQRYRLVVTWTVKHLKVVVTADDVKQAMYQVNTKLIELGREDELIDVTHLIPLPTHHRYTRFL